MKYLLRLILYSVIVFFSWSILSVVVYKFVPVTVTPLKFKRLFDNFGDKGLRVESKWCSIENVSDEMIRAVMASEDNNFLMHGGLDYKAIDRAIKDHKRGARLRGASTISQQTAKNVFCLPSRTWLRKGVEMYYTFLIETIWGKKRIMEVYLNIIETGKGVYGVESTAKKFYGKKPSELNAYEASMIAAVLPNPLIRDIAHPSGYMVNRAARIRANMRNLGPVDSDDLKKMRKND